MADPWGSGRRRAVVLLAAGLLTLAACSAVSTGGTAAIGSNPGTPARSSGAGGPTSMTGMPGMTEMTSAPPVTSFTVTAPSTSVHPAAGTTAPRTAHAPVPGGLPGMPPVLDAHNVYSAAGAGMILPKERNYPAYAYVPHNISGDVWVIDQKTYAVVRKCPVGKEIQHVVPSYDMTMLYATDDVGDVIRAIDPATGECGATFKVKDPYNMYFTPDGKYAISVAERYRELVWYDPKTWTIHDTTDVPDCDGIDHADFSPDGRTAVFTCEFAGRVVVVDMVTHRVIRTVDMPVMNTTMGPQDIKLAPDGSAYFIADSDSNGVWVMNGTATKVLRHIATGLGAHGLYLSRDAKELYVTNRHEGSISVLNAYTGAIEAKWTIPGGGSPDMGNVSADGTRLWISGRYDNVLYVFDTVTGQMIQKIPVGEGPHGLALMPLPGRYSLGHTGITR